jgi:hypothetical protein
MEPNRGAGRRFGIENTDLALTCSVSENIETNRVHDDLSPNV